MHNKDFKSTLNRRVYNLYGYTHVILLENKLILSQANIPDGKNEYQWDAWDALIKGFGMHIKLTSIKNGMRLEKLMGLDGCN